MKQSILQLVNADLNTIQTKFILECEKIAQAYHITLNELLSYSSAVFSDFATNCDISDIKEM